MATKKTDLNKSAQKKISGGPKRKTPGSAASGVSRKATGNKENIQGLKWKIAELGRLASFPVLNPHPIIEVESSGKIIFINNAAKEILRKLHLVRRSDLFLPGDMKQILKDESNKKRKKLYREISIGDRVFGEWIYFAPEFHSARIYAHDITDSKRAEAGLKQTETLLRKEHDFMSAILSTAGALVIVLDGRGRIVNFNAACEQLTGYSFNEVKGKCFWEFLLVPEEIAPVKAVFRDLKAGQFPNRFENFWVSRDGIRRLISWTNTALLDGKGNAEFIVGTGIDITAQRQAEEKLETAFQEVVNEKNRLEAVMRALPVGIAIVDRLGGNIQANRVFEEIWAGPRPKVQHIEDYMQFKAWWADTGKSVMPEEWASARAVQKGETVVGQLMEIERFDGSMAVVLNSAAPIFDDKGKIIGSAVAIQDITELRRTEEALQRSEVRYRSLVDMSPGAIFVNRENRIVFLNPAALQLFGATRPEQVLGRSPFEMFHADYQPVMQERIRLMLEQNQDVPPIEASVIQLDGSTRYVEVAAAPFDDSEGRAIQVVLRDITEHKRAEERLNKESREIELSNRILEVFIKESGDDLYDKVLNIILKETASRHGVFGYIAEPGHLICPSLSKMLDECEIEGKCIHYPPEKWKGLWARALKEKRSLYTNEQAPVPRGHPIIRNNLAVPILFQGEAIGLLNLANKKGGYSEADRGTLDGIADRIAPVLYAQIQKELRETERKQAEEILRESESKYRSLFTNMTSGFAFHKILINDTGQPYDYVFLQINDAFECLTGLSREIVVGKRATEVFPGIENDPADWIGVYGKVALSGEAISFENYAAALKKWYSVSAYSPAKEYFAVTFEDITERKQRIDLNDGLNRINEIISSTLDPDEIMRRAVAEACKVIGSETAGITLREDGHWVSKYTYLVPPQVEGVRFTDQEVPEVALAAKIKKPVVINDTAHDERVNRRIREKYGVRSVLVLPLILKLEEEVLGVMGFYFHSAPSTFTDAQIDFATKLGVSVSLAFEKARLFVKDKEAIRLSNALNFINMLVTSTLDVDGIMRSVLGEATKAIGAETTGVSFREKDHWAVKYVHGLPEQVINLLLTDEENPHGFLAISKKKVIAINDAFSDIRVDREVMEKFEIRAVLVVPLYSKEKPIGAIFFNYHTSPVKFTDVQIDFAHKLGMSISLALENARLFQEIKEAEESLRESEGDLIRAQDVGKIGSWRMDVRRNVLTWSDENHRIFGVPKGTPLTYESFLSTVHPDDREYVDRKWKEGLSGVDYDIEHRILVNGNTKWVREKAYLEFDDSGQLIGGFGITQDITEKKLAETELRESEERLNMALYAGRVFGFEWNPLTDDVIRSKNCGIILGLSGEEAIHDTGRAFFHRVHPEDRETFTARIDSLTTENNKYSMKYRLVRPDGESIVLEETAIGQFDSRGQLIKLYGMTADVTQRTKAEEALMSSRTRLSILSEAAAQLLATERPEQIVDDLCNKVMTFLNCHVFFNYLIDEEKKQLHLNAYAGIPPDTARGIEWLDIGAAVCGCVARDGQRVIAENIPESDDPRTDLVRSFGIKTYACHPLIAQGKVIGTLSFGTRSRTGFTEDELHLMSTIADQVSIAMQRVMHHQKLQKYSEELEREVQERTKEIREKVEIIDLERKRLYSVLEQIPAYVCLMTADYTFAYVNQEFKRRFGDPERRYCYEFLFDRQKPCEDCMTYRVFSEQKDQQWEWTGPDGKTYAIYDYRFIDSDRSHLILEMGVDITEFKKAVKNLSGTNTLLDLFTKTTSRRGYIESVVPVLQQWSGFRCVGIRIADDEENIPYEAYTGFSDEFYQLENKLSLKKDMCACIRTITGRFEPQDFSVLSEFGSICINNAEKFAESLTKEDFARYRGNCIRSGFQSIVLVPIRYRGKTIGLIHLADERPGMAPLAVLQFLEVISNIIGEAIQRFNTEAALRKSEASLSEAQRIAHMGSWEWDIRSSRLNWSDEVYRIFGLSHQEFMPSYEIFLSFVHPDDRESLEEAIKEALYQKNPYTMDHRIVLLDGQEKIVHEQGEIVFDERGFPLRMLGTVHDITNVKHIEQELRLSGERIRELYAHLHSVREAERAHIAREIHDEFGTILTALNIDLSWLEKKLPKDQQTFIERIKKDVELINSAIKIVQRISSELRPGVLDYLGLSSAVEWQVKEFGNRTGLEWDIDIDMKTTDLDKDLSVALFRILQESLTNIARYAEASKIKVRLAETDSVLTLQVADDGKGITEEQLSDPISFGILGMRERVQYLGGDITIKGMPHQGTTVTVKVPVVKQGAKE